MHVQLANQSFKQFTGNLCAISSKNTMVIDHRAICPKSMYKVLKFETAIILMKHVAYSVSQVLKMK